jgi:hypothetical protein
VKARLCPAAAAAQRESPYPLRWRTGAAALKPGCPGRAGVAVPCGPFKLGAPRWTRLLRRPLHWAAAAAAAAAAGGGGRRRRAAAAAATSYGRSARDGTGPGGLDQAQAPVDEREQSVTVTVARPHCEAGAGRSPRTLHWPLAPGRWRVAPLARSAHAGRMRRLNAGPVQRPRFSIHTRKSPAAISSTPSNLPHVVCGGACQCHVRGALRLRNQGAREATPIDMPLGAAQSGFP